MIKQLITLVLSGLGLAAVAEPRYLITSHKPDTISIINTDGSIEWQHTDIKHPQDAEMTEKGDIFCSEIPGAKMIARDHSVVWEYKVPEGCQNPVAQVLGENRFLVGNEGPGKLLEIDGAGEVLKEIQLSPKNKKPHGQFRFCQKTPQGTYLVPETNDKVVKEYAADGTVIRHFGTFKVPVSAIRLKNGNTLIGSYGRIDEFDGSGKCVWSYEPFEEGSVKADGKKKAHVTGIAETENGNIALALYHMNADWPDILEVTKEKKVVRKVVLENINKVASLRVIK